MSKNEDKSIYAEVRSLLASLVEGRCYSDVTPDAPEFPLIIYQVVGGEAIDFYERTVANTENYRVQVYVWGARRLEVEQLMRMARKQLVEHSANFESLITLGQATDEYNETLKIYGSRQDFSAWLRVRGDS